MSGGTLASGLRRRHRHDVSQFLRCVGRAQALGAPLDKAEAALVDFIQKATNPIHRMEVILESPEEHAPQGGRPSDQGTRSIHLMMSLLTHEPATLRPAGIRARAKVEARYSPAVVAKAHVELYERLLASRRVQQ